MKKHWPILFFTVLISSINISIVKAQTFLSGIISIDSTLRLANSPYVVTGSLIVSPNVTLTVEPGVIVKFNSNVGISLKGKLVANGTLLDTIRFTSDVHNRSSWGGLRIENFVGAKVECSYFVGEYGNCFFENLRTLGTDTVIKLLHCHFNSNYEVIYSDYNTNDVRFINSCTFSNNSLVYTGNASCILKNSICYNNVRVLYNTSSTNPPTIVDSCIIHDNTDGLSFIYGSITNSTFYNNGTAIHHQGAGNVVRNCDIYQNDIGIRSWHTSVNSVSQVTQNRICHNDYNIYVSWSADFNVINNCWCLTDSTQIRATMYDFFSSFSLGVVNYSPFDTTCSFTVSVENTIGPNFSFQIFPNPVIDNLTLQLLANISISTVSIYNVIGKLEHTDKVGSQALSLDVSNLKRGIYIIEISNGINISRQKFVKQ